MYVDCDLLEVNPNVMHPPLCNVGRCPAIRENIFGSTSAVSPKTMLAILKCLRIHQDHLWALSHEIPKFDESKNSWYMSIIMKPIERFSKIWPIRYLYVPLGVPDSESKDATDHINAIKYVQEHQTDPWYIHHNLPEIRDNWYLEISMHLKNKFKKPASSVDHKIINMPLAISSSANHSYTPMTPRVQILS